MTETMLLLCVCDEEWCFCPVIVEAPDDGEPDVPDIACALCAAGHHVWSPGGGRS